MLAWCFLFEKNEMADKSSIMVGKIRPMEDKSLSMVTISKNREKSSPVGPINPKFQSASNLKREIYNQK
ncbi:hypothetical protein [Metabacillus litoralis]|jgi:hypothetical protein|uniref:hypothetical protein n=1 Tax=Metabacillus litoralis TaxID=152268 RepID=UPI00203B6097|nr:hypothetical protein [Metabacillus litoralis]